MRRLFAVFLFMCLSAAFASPIVETKKISLGQETLVVGFSEYPPKAERSIDLVFSLESGVQRKDGSRIEGNFVLRQPNGEVYTAADKLPRFPRDRTVWGLDSIALPTEGTWKLEVNINNLGKAMLEIPVLERPTGPSNSLIYLLSSLPMLALMVLGWRAWGRVRPTRHVEANGW